MYNYSLGAFGPILERECCVYFSRLSPEQEHANERGPAGWSAYYPGTNSNDPKTWSFFVET